MSDSPYTITPPDTPGAAAGATDRISRLSLDHASPSAPAQQPRRGRGMLGAASAVAPKRSASSDLPTEGRQSPRQRQTVTSRIQAGQGDSHVPSGSCESLTILNQPPAKKIPLVKVVVARDNGYDSSIPSRSNTHTSINPTTIRSAPATHQGSLPAPSVREHDVDSMAQRRKGAQPPANNSRYPGLILQPDSSPISQDQLANEVKGIYAGLVMVEAKCINIDAAQAADPKSYLGPEQWQALIALHRTLLYEHHDFLMATQHPSATPALRGLATKYSMPARMWKHGIHAFLEVIRHRRPESQDYMLAFIYLAYQMMVLLFETVPSFTDTWIECLGDLARYRMAIEEEKEAHATWGGVAARWYTMASDRHPAIGRLYHHLAILERPSLRKFCFYAKSLTCVIPFPNARDSLSTLCGPIVQDDSTIQSSRQSAEARIVTYHALVCSGRDQSIITSVGKDSLILLGQQPTKLRDFGAYLAVTNVAALFELGSPTNTLWQLYTAAINQAMQNARPSTTAGVQAHNNLLSTITPDISPKPTLISTTSYLFDCFDFVIGRYSVRDSLKDALAYVHVSLVWLHSLHALNTRLNVGRHKFDIPFELGRFAWDGLVIFLNTLALEEPINAHMLECARKGSFPAPIRKEDAHPLSEDYIIRGLIWAQFYFCPGWFDGQSEDDGRAIETPSMAKSRAERVLWLGLYFAFRTEHIQYDGQKKKFFSASTVRRPEFKTESVHPAAVEPTNVEMEQVSEAVAVSPRSEKTSPRTSNSSMTSSEDGFCKVRMPNSTQSSQAPAKRKVRRQDFDGFKVADENGEVPWGR